ncbi:glycoside hydrolase family 3 N-terminal domain-containing protein [Nocardia seriolae]|nr:glycoside hydrolase family 3 N-terminal domain-containing protein [Nocardia seriolae]APA95134.1 Beta-N-acetylhexosaminidase [Nocardia seriolae]MTJ66768.1 glycoside hydrolase family 3 protein [Nocardia seriolae]MTJ70434.1 glycoside hydrolase family 3 protein [Nocardia seriolae]MTJ85397.1 glycoside hydrolase family 3 protein [Nocardia seriolae]MTK29393.1 glycoside hydrolase family 3 protein [Nocardia seriolae]
MRLAPGIVVAVTALALTACSSGSNSSNDSASSSSAAPSSTVPPITTPGQQDCAAGYLSQFTTRQKLAQLLTVGVTGAADAANVVKTEQIGGIFIGSWTDKAMLAQHQVDAVQKASRTPLMVTIDEEGGRVSRAKDLIGPAPSAKVIAQTMTPEQFYAFSLDRAKALEGYGVTVDFAPDVDVTSQPDDSVIGDRSFSDDPEKVVEYAGAFIRALHDAGVGSVMKHFPGHGSGSGDSHTGAVRTPPLDQMQDTDLVPFRKLVDSGAAVMVGHLDVPGLTTPNVPASISKEAMDLLRKGTGYGAAPFDGVIFTDDLGGMAAITSRMTIEEAVEKALVAGADNALWITTDAVPKVLDRLEDAVKTGRLPVAQVDASVLRMAKFKGSARC